MTDLVQQNESAHILNAPPKVMVEQVTQMADVLKDVIDKQKMYNDISGKKYVKAEGWSTLGTMLGILPQEKEVKKIENGYEAYINLVNKNGVIIGGASNICTREEKRWKHADDYAVRSMAITRATGKAYRLSFAWIMQMAGYQTTPSEEMPEEDKSFDKKNKKKSKKTEKVEYKLEESNDIPTPKQQTLYDRDNQKMQDALIKILEEKSVPFEFWDDIGNDLNGSAFNIFQVDKSIKKIVK